MIFFSFLPSVDGRTEGAALCQGGNTSVGCWDGCTAASKREGLYLAPQVIDIMFYSHQLSSRGFSVFTKQLTPSFPTLCLSFFLSQLLLFISHPTSALKHKCIFPKSSSWLMSLWDQNQFFNVLVLLALPLKFLIVSPKLCYKQHTSLPPLGKCPFANSSPKSVTNEQTLQ